jgi:hypothetical protein
MGLLSFDVEELSSPLRIAEEVILYGESQMGPQRNTRYGRRYDRTKLGLENSPENFFYNEGQWEGAPYVNLNSLEFTCIGGEAEALVYDTIPGTEMFAVTEGSPAEIGPPAVDEIVTGKLKLKINELLIEQIEVREGDTYTLCDAAGDPVDTTIHQIHISLKSHNKPDFTFYEWHPQAKYRFNRQCNLVTDMTDETLKVGYMGDNNYVLSPAQFEATLAIVEGL